jgi:hypothetical protein
MQFQRNARNAAKAAIATGLLVTAAGIGYVGWPRAITEQSLSAQLEGAHCRFKYEIDGCTQRSIEPLNAIFIEEHDCDLWAVQCLAEFATQEARQIMVQVLMSKADVQTCDGVSSIRSQAVFYLGNSGDLSAIAPLRELLVSRPMQKLSPGASGCKASSEDLEVIRSAISKLEGN